MNRSEIPQNIFRSSELKFTCRSGSEHRTQTRMCMDKLNSYKYIDYTIFEWKSITILRQLSFLCICIFHVLLPGKLFHAEVTLDRIMNLSSSDKKLFKQSTNYWKSSNKRAVLVEHQMLHGYGTWRPEQQTESSAKIGILVWQICLLGLDLNSKQNIHYSYMAQRLILDTRYWTDKPEVF